MGVGVSYERDAPVVLGRQPSRVSRHRAHLTRCSYSLVLESQIPRKTVNLVFQLVIVDNKLPMFGGS